MHELGIAQEIVEIVARRAGESRVARVVLEVGALSMVFPDSIRFCFDLCAAGTAVEGASLEILEIPGRALCRACQTEIALNEPYGACPCGGVDLKWLAGDELRIKEMEVI